MFVLLAAAGSMQPKPSEPKAEVRRSFLKRALARRQRWRNDMRTQLAVALLGTALVGWPALAQTSPPAGNAPADTPAATAPRSSQSAETSKATTPLKPGQWRASKLVGLNVYNNNDEDIGDINEIIVSKDGKIESVVVGVGGFLGMGEHSVAVPFSEIKFSEEPRRTAARTDAPATTANPPAANTTGSVGTTAPTDRTGSTPADRAYPDHAMLNMSKDQLKALPRVTYSK
jgi:sporulation protein YlmC with PRC-barrel domain